MIENNNKVIYSQSKPGSMDRKNLSSISLNKSENNLECYGNYQGGVYSNVNQMEDPLYKQYKNNMLGSINSNRNTQREQIKKNESESNVTEIILPVKIKSDDKDDWIRELKVTMVVSFPTPSKQQIVINITDPNDPLFLYILEIGEQEFHFLKQELSLLIEFQHFPGKFFEMLDLCLKDSLGKENLIRDQISENLLNKSFMISNYVAILHHNTTMNESLFIIQEITQFRQLNHLILRFKPANDAALKKYLSNLVKEFKGKSESYTKENSRLNENLEVCYRDLKAYKDELTSIKAYHSHEVENLKLEHQKELNETKEKFLEELKTKLEQKENERLNLQGESESKIEELNGKITLLNKEKLALEDLKIKLEASERDLTGRNSILQSELKVYKEEVDNLRSTTTNMNQSSLSQEKELTEYKIKHDLLLKQIEEKERNTSNLTQLVDNLTKQKSDMEDTIKMIKNTNNKLEDKLQASIAEINKGNEIIQKLQADIKSQKEKMKLKQQSLKTQEQLINQKQNSVEDLLRNVNDMKREVEKKDEEVKGLKLTIENYRLKMEEAEKVCEDNAKVIRFLNQKLNDSYQPFRNIMKTDFGSTNGLGGTIGSGGVIGSTNFNIGGNTNTNNVPLSSLRNFNNGKNEENIGIITNTHNDFENNKNVEYMNTGSSFNKQPYFNSLAFQSQGSFNTGVGGGIVNTLGKDNTTTTNNNNNGFILPETNFSNFKSTLNNLNSNTNNINSDTLPRTKYTTNNNTRNTNILSHKYGGQSNSKSSENNFNIKQMQYEEEEEPRQAPINNDKNIFQHKINY